MKETHKMEDKHGMNLSGVRRFLKIIWIFVRQSYTENLLIKKLKFLGDFL